MKRVLIATILLAIALWAYPIAGFILAIVFALIQPYPYYEIIFLGIVIDVVYQTGISIGSARIPLYTILAVILFWLASRIKKRINFYA